MRVAVAIRYDMNTKNQLVLKAADVVESQRIEWDKNLKEIPASFMAVRRTTTQSGNAMTFVADRSGTLATRRRSGQLPTPCITNHSTTKTNRNPAGV